MALVDFPMFFFLFFSSPPSLGFLRAICDVIVGSLMFEEELHVSHLRMYVTWRTQQDMRFSWIRFLCFIVPCA